MVFRGSNLHRKSLVGRPAESTDARLGACVNGLVRGNYSGKGAAQTFQGQFMKGSGTGWGRPVPIKLAFYWANLGTGRAHPFHELALQTFEVAGEGEPTARNEALRTLVQYPPAPSTACLCTADGQATVTSLLR